MYQQKAWALYQLFFKDWEQELPPRLILVPEGILSFLPFEALLTDSLSAEQASWQDMPYLIQSYQISYAYSAAVLHEQVYGNRKKQPAKLLALAPFAHAQSISEPATQFAGLSRSESIYQLRAGNWGELAASEAEVQHIQEIWGGKVLLNQQAEKAAFLSQAPHFSILHLATHAKAHDNIPWLSLLAFADTTAPLPELASKHFPAEMVVLSACESGLGQLKDGEGVISLARAFTQAGAKSLVTTLWQVDDQATAHIMADFYLFLSQGMPKDEALQSARLAYLNQSEPDFAHPFFWGAFAASGDMRPLARETNKPIMAWLGVILLLGGIAFLFTRWRKKSRNL